MKSMYNEEQNRKALEFLKKQKTNITRKKISREEMERIINDNNLTSVRRIDFNNNNITNDIAFINFESGKHKLIITNEKGCVTTSTEYDDIEEAYAALIDSLLSLKEFM